jgi:hypothetical protein
MDRPRLRRRTDKHEHRPRLHRKVKQSPNRLDPIEPLDDYGGLEVHRYALPRYGYLADGEPDAEIEALQPEEA